MEAHELNFSYAGGTAIIHDCNESFVSGEVVALAGPSGRGKSTLLYLLGLLMRPSSGDVHLNGIQTASLPERQRAWLRATEIGFVFQDSQLDSTRSVIDNVVEGARYRRDDLGLARVRGRELLDEFRVSVPHLRKPGQISGGQAQRIALARALLGNPHVILADEPTGNLDQATAELVLHAFRRHADNGGLVLVATHDPAVLTFCDRRVVL